MERELYGQIRDIEQDHWWYVGRRRIVFEWIARAVAPFPAPRVLDIGCGTGFNLEHLEQLGVRRAVGLDVSSDALRFCRSRQLHTLVQGDGSRLPFAAASFEVVIALDLIEHIERDEAALGEIARVLAPGGALVIFTPAYQFLWSLQDEVSHHFRRYTAHELDTKLRLAGFDVRKLTYANTLLFPLVWGGRLMLRLRGPRGETSENDLHPSWSNRLLARVFAAEAPLLRRTNLPFGVSLLSYAVKS